MQQQILFKHIFWSNYHLSNFFWNLWRQTNRYSSKKVNIWTPSGYFPFFISFFCWNEINKKSSMREDTRKIRSSRLSLQLYLKKRLCHRCFPVNFAKFLRTPLLQNTSSGCFWNVENCKADNIAHNFFTEVTRKEGKWSLCKERLYKGLMIFGRC